MQGRFGSGQGYGVADGPPLAVFYMSSLLDARAGPYFCLRSTPGVGEWAYDVWGFLTRKFGPDPVLGKEIPHGLA